jgi:hypothetical protein
LLLCGVVVLCACSDGESGSEGHMWQEQTDMIDKAQHVEDVLDSANELQRQRIEAQSQ